ncbi:MAG TPA: hypothetical protein VMI54_00365 [Polyangiaceae bacterium]|nr:hypothetical protein [Polyangiaceae bacterium]
MSGATVHAKVDLGAIRHSTLAFSTVHSSGLSNRLLALAWFLTGCASATPLPATAPPAPPPAAPRRRTATEIPPAVQVPTPGPAPSAPPARALPLAEVDDAGPLSLERMGASGAWLVVCRQNGAPRLELALSGRPLEPLDDLLGWDPTGEFVVVRRAGVVSLLDVATGASTNLSELGFDDRDDVLDYRQHRALAFDPRGEILAYVRKNPNGAIVLRTLATGAERTAVTSGGEPWRLAWDASGATLVVDTVAADPARPGHADFPVHLRHGARLACSGLLPHFHVNADLGVRPSTLLVTRDGLVSRVVTDFALPFGQDYVARGSDGALALVRAGKRLPLGEADCGGRVLMADPTRDLLLVSCTNDKARPKHVGVELVGPGFRQELGVVVQSMALDRWPEVPSRLVPLYPGSDALLVDLDARRTVPLAPGDRVLATSGAAALVRRDKTLVWIDTLRGSETVLFDAIPPFAGLVVEGSLVAVGSLVVDVAAGRVLGTLPGRPLALSAEGAGLIPEGGFQTSTAFARGPLRWRPPVPPSVD